MLSLAQAEWGVEKRRGQAPLPDHYCEGGAHHRMTERR